MDIKDNFVQAIDYMIQSPFVQKINGIPSEWDPIKIKFETVLLDNRVAKEIYKSTYMLSSIRKALENARDIILAAGQDAPEQCMEALREHYDGTTAMQRELAPIQKELQKLPKVDDAFIEVCREKEQSLIKEREAKKEATQKSGGKLQQAHASSMHGFKRYLIGAFFAILIGLIGLFVLKPTTAMLQIVFGVFGIFGGFIASICSLMLMLVEIVSYKKRQSGPEGLTSELRQIDALYDNELADLHKQMEKGYGKGSALYAKIESLNQKMTLVEDAYKAKMKDAERFEAILRDPFREAPPLLQRTIDNMDSLAAWAANHIHDRDAWDHNEKMQFIERERLRAQEEANREQSELLRQQAAAAAQQARDTAEIKERMQKERYGDFWKNG